MGRKLVAVADACLRPLLPGRVSPLGAPCQIPVPAQEQNLKGTRRYQHCGECHQLSWCLAPPSMWRLAANVSWSLREQFDSPQLFSPVVPHMPQPLAQPPRHGTPPASSPGLVLEHSLEKSRQNLRGESAGPWYPPGDPAYRVFTYINKDAPQTP